jgi:hypothetical protein
MKLALTAATVAAMLPYSLATPIDLFGAEGKQPPASCDPDQGHSNAAYYWNEQSQGKFSANTSLPSRRTQVFRTHLHSLPRQKNRRELLPHRDDQRIRPMRDRGPRHDV